MGWGVVWAALAWTSAAQASTLIRDAEIEHTLRRFGDPLFQAAGLTPSAVKIFIVRDDALNSYVAGGSNLFIHTGMILQSPTPDMLIGVMAHETAHIAGGHLARGSEKLKNAEMGAIFTYVLGAAAAVATQKPEAAAAVIGGGSTTIMRNVLAFTRAHEEAADQAALGYLDRVGISASGMAKVFAMLERQRRERVGSVDPYLQTHPLSASRIEHVRHHVASAAIPEGQYPKAYDAPHQRMLAKLYGFLKTPEQTFQRYPQSDKSAAARMARAIAYYKMPDVSRATAEMDTLIAQSTNDPFLHELKGQILFENARLPEALASYQTAAKLAPNSPLILTDLAKVEMAQKEPLVDSATRHLERASNLDKTNPATWRLLAIAYGKQGQGGMDHLALAEEAALQGNFEEALTQADYALRKLKEGAPARRRANDLKAHAIEMVQQAKEEASPF